MRIEVLWTVNEQEYSTTINDFIREEWYSMSEREREEEVEDHVYAAFHDQVHPIVRNVTVAEED